MSLSLYLKFQKMLNENNLENKLDVSQAMSISEDIILSESVPERITEAINKLYGKEDGTKLIECIKNTFEGDYEETEDEDIIDDDELTEAFGSYVDNIVDALMEGDDDDNDDDDDDDDDDEDEDVDESRRPKKLTGAAKKSRDAKAQLMALVRKDPEIKSIMAKAKAKIIKKAKAIGKKNGIKVNRINFDKIKL